MARKPTQEQAAELDRLTAAYTNAQTREEKKSAWDAKEAYAQSIGIGPKRNGLTCRAGKRQHAIADAMARETAIRAARRAMWNRVAKETV